MFESRAVVLARVSLIDAKTNHETTAFVSVDKKGQSENLLNQPKEQQFQFDEPGGKMRISQFIRSSASSVEVVITTVDNSRDKQPADVEKYTKI